MVTTDLDHMVLQASLCSGEPTDQHQAIAGAFSFISFLLKIFGLEVESLRNRDSELCPDLVWGMD